MRRKNMMPIWSGLPVSFAVHVKESGKADIEVLDSRKLAVSSLKQQKAGESKKQKNIYYCGCCGRALFNAHYGTVFCKQRSFKTDSDCKDVEICKHDADMAVLAAVKKEAELYLDRDKLSRQAAKRNESLSVSDRISAIVKSMEAAQKG